MSEYIEKQTALFHENVRLKIEIERLREQLRLAQIDNNQCEMEIAENEQLRDELRLVTDRYIRDRERALNMRVKLEKIREFLRTNEEPGLDKSKKSAT